jgi:hypothetical protein
MTERDRAFLLYKVNGLRWNSQVEFEEQCALRGYDFRGKYKIVDGTVRLTPDGEAIAAKHQPSPAAR